MKMKDFVLFILGTAVGAAAAELRRKESRDAASNTIKKGVDWFKDKCKQAKEAAEEAAETVEEKVEEAANGGENAGEQPTE